MRTKLLILGFLLIGGPIFAESYKWKVTNQLVQRLSDGALIPNDTGNRDWQAYQVWVSSGGPTLPADQSPTSAQILADLRTGALAQLDDTASFAKKDRAVLLVLIDELNILRGRFNDLSNDVASATSLADLKNRWATHPTLTDRTIGQVQPALQNKISSGQAD